MTNATGEFRISAFSSQGIRVERNVATHASPAQMLTKEPEPLSCQLGFANGDELQIVFQGSGHEPSSFWMVMDSIKRLAELPVGWNSYNSQPLSVQAVTRSFGLLPILLLDDVPTPAVVPTHDGGLQFEWHRSGVDFEVRVPPTGPVSYFFADANSGSEGEREGTMDPESVRAALAHISQAA
jgi:hypothetical protein